MKTIDDALRDGCEVAGLRIYLSGMNTYYTHDDGCEPWLAPYCWRDNDPALPAYVASLLVERAWAAPGFYYEALFALKPYAPSQWSGLATTNFRILAALVALGHWSLEEAREAARD